jgi:hypothetical protein
MTTTNRHEMQLKRSHPSGAEEWHCPDCQRAVVMHHQPEFGRLKVIVLTPGDELASHHGAVGGLALHGVAAQESHVEAPLQIVSSPAISALH